MAIMMGNMNDENGLDADSVSFRAADYPKGLVLLTLQRNHIFAECQSCGRMITTAGHAFELSTWRFDYMGLRPSILKTAKGVCQECQKRDLESTGLLAAIERIKNAGKN